LSYKYLIRNFLILTISTFACGMPVTSTLPTPAPEVSVRGLTYDQLGNAQYRLGARDDHATVKMTDGKYKQGTDTSTLDFADVELTDFIALGDLTGDGKNEAAAIFFENYGGTGNFGFLTIFSNINNQPIFLTSSMIDDRPKINQIKIEDGKVYLDTTIHGTNDPGCCPRLPTTRRYALVNNQLRLMNYTTATPDGTKRVISIKEPEQDAQVTDSIQVSGKVSIAPFENNLPYFIYDESGKQILSGPTKVVAPDLGAPGIFSETVSLTGISAGTVIYLEVQDLSMADGSLLAMDAVKLIVK
jgi:hypothetical protein